MKLKDTVVVITGGSRGFGKELARLFVAEGSRVVVSSSNQTEVDETAKELGALGIYADVTKEEDLTKLLEETVKSFGTVDIWINNAGLWMSHSFVEDFEMDRIRKIFDVNVIGTINGSRVALRYMKPKGTGTIINTISDSALGSRPMSSVYSASKWAVNGFTKSIREEDMDIAIFSIYPAAMKTEIFGQDKPKDFDSFMDPTEVAEKVIENLKLDAPQEELIIQEI